MKKRYILFSFVLLPAVLFLTGCSDTQQAPEEAQAENAVPSSSTQDDHHAGETNIAPHDDSEMSDDHHDGEENVEPHEHEGDHDDTGQPPHRH